MAATAVATSEHFRLLCREWIRILILRMVSCMLLSAVHFMLVIHQSFSNT